MIVLDTDVMIDLLRQYPPAVIWLSSLGSVELVLPGYVVMELIQGCRNKIEHVQSETLCVNKRSYNSTAIPESAVA